jgi:putative ABC transport system substrate-binding protein
MAAFPKFHARKGHTAEEDRAYFRDVILVKNDVFVADMNGRCVGFIAIAGDLIDQLYVDPASQRQGVGTSLIAYAKELSPLGLHLFTLEVNANGRAFYETNGFRATGFGIPPRQSRNRMSSMLDTGRAGARGPGDRVRRRAFVYGAIALFGAPRVARAQTAGTVPRVGFLYFGSHQTGPGADRYAAFLAGMRDLGYVTGKDVVVEARFAESNAERLPELARDLLRLKVDVIVATATPTYRVLQRLTATVPVVVTVTADPVMEGLAASVARPGRNFTGLSDTAADLSSKQLELFRAVLPKLSRVGVLLNPDNTSHPAQVTRLMLAGQAFGIQVVLAEASTAAGVESGFASLARQRADAVILFGDTFFAQQVRQTARLALEHRLPSTFILREYAEAGGLMSYGAPLTENFRRAAAYVDKILKGAKPGDLPFEQPTQYVLLINLATAKTLGLTVPPSVLVRADQVIE